MSTKSKALFFSLSFILCSLLYWTALTGTPIWDDVTFWFFDPAMGPGSSYLSIWANYAWPFSVSFQKFTLSLWGKNYLYYHVFSLFLHFANSFLVYKLGKCLRLKHTLLYFFLFLFHPAAVITTAWMIQIKTLLCFFFGLGSFLTFLEGQKKFPWIILSWMLFALSLTSKSASLPLPFIMLIISYRRDRFSKLPLLLPFFLLAGWSGQRLLRSPITLQGAQKAIEVSKIKIDPAPSSSVVVTAARPPRQDILPKQTLTFPDVNFDLFAQTLHYYFWQILIPKHNEPVKGPNFESPGIIEYIHLIFLVLMALIFWKDQIFLYLMAGHILLLPFLGLIPAPYMSVTWVSDQHLYLALPALLAFWAAVLEKLPWKHALILPVFLLIYFASQTHRASLQYKDQFVFYEKSLEFNPYNIPMAYNLAYARLLNGEWPVAYSILVETYELSERTPSMKKGPYYPYLAFLYFQFKTALEKK